MTLTFLVGGARSGKSSLAVDLATRSGLAVTFVATAPAPAIDAEDDEMVDRIARHRLERPDGWTTVEEPIDLSGALLGAGKSFVIVDCLTLWVSNLMWHDCTDSEIERITAETIDTARGAALPIVVVSNEVGLGIHPDTALGRRFRDVLGRVNQRWAAAADVALLLVAGRALRLDDPVEMLAHHHRAARITAP
jgi:adenosylcobinamide kinase / adenosylcobinamide-phosphate guanylyltransferase